MIVIITTFHFFLLLLLLFNHNYHPDGYYKMSLRIRNAY
jgi:hypothetical protein